jgi:hypothetical protein
MGIVKIDVMFTKNQVEPTDRNVDTHTDANGTIIR